MRSPWAATVLVATVVAISACGERESDHGGRAVGEVDQVAPPSSGSNPPKGAIGGGSSGTTAFSTSTKVHGSIEVSIRDVIQVGEERWIVSHTKDPDGSFVLFRNKNRSHGIVEVSFREDKARTVGARETVTWECNKTDEGPIPVEVGTSGGATIYVIDVECGDGLYVRTEAGQ